MKTLAVEGMTHGLRHPRNGPCMGSGGSVLFFDHGKLLEDASPSEFFDAPKDPRAQAFLRQVL